MKKSVSTDNEILTDAGRAGERGSAIVIALFVLALISVFVALAMSRSSAEAPATGNESMEGKTLYAAQGSLEMMTRNFNKKFEVNLRPTSVEFDDVRNSPVPGLSTSVGGQYNFVQEVLLLPNQNNVPVPLIGGPFGGLLAKRDNWRLRTTATNNVGVQVQLTRNILNNLIPIFQFGIFYDDDLEFHPGPRFDFGGRVHSNGNLFLQANDGVYFASKVTTANHIFTDVSKNGSPWTNWDDEVYVRNASNNYVQLRSNMGSVLASPANGAAVTSNPAPTIPLPTAYVNASWATNQPLFDGNLLANTPLLQLPLKLNSDNTNQDLALNEVIKRGKSVGDVWNSGTHASPNITAVTTATKDDAITASERYYNKTGIRVSLADFRNRLPGCAAATDASAVKCGVRLDGDSVGQTTGAIPVGATRGYVPRAQIGTPAYQATAVNGDRFHLGIAGRELWIKVETVIYNPVSESYVTEDITQDILSLGVTEPAPNITSNFVIQDANYNANGYDSRSIIKLQRFVMPGDAVPNTTGAGATAGYISSATWAGDDYNYVRPATISNSPGTNRCNNTGVAVAAAFADDDRGTIPASGNYFHPSGFAGDDRAHWKTATITGVASKYGCVVPFPINVFDTREGLYNDSTSVFSPTAAGNYGLNVPWTGVMSMVDIDVNNLRRFLNGDWDGNMPTGTPYHTATSHVLRGNDIPQPTNVTPKAGGWVLYVSDRRGDRDFDGEYDMEDVYGNNDGTLQPGEDVNRNTTLQADYGGEALRYTGTANGTPHISPDIAAVFEHRFFRRGVRLINGQTIPGFYDTTTPANTRGFTVASENAVYVKGNYNATGIASVGTPTPSVDYLPRSTTSLDIPASVAADAVIIMSNAWQDGNSFSSPFSLADRVATETHMRFAMLAGDTITSLNATPNQGGGDPRMNGGVHNFKRFLENWGGTRLNYSGSLINLFNSRNNNGTFKCCDKVYSPPDRNWVFDATFLDINRLPPGTPYFQYAQTTGFQRTND